MRDDFFDRFKQPDETEEKPIAFDWRGGEIYEGETCYNINGELVLEDDLKEYADAVFGKAEVV